MACLPPIMGWCERERERESWVGERERENHGLVRERERESWVGVRERENHGLV